LHLEFHDAVFDAEHAKVGDTLLLLLLSIVVRVGWRLPRNGAKDTGRRVIVIGWIGGE